ncbi:MAG: RDD family protein [Undibacterium sp.]|nr:RDD family protein [Undibacterium sp.]
MTPIESQNSYPTPSLTRRLVCMIYEALLVFGVIVFTHVIHAIATQSFDPTKYHYSRLALLFFTCGAYFVYFWTRGGQTLAMKTWKIRLVNDDNQKLPLVKSMVRYCLAWMWFLPGLILSSQLGLKNAKLMTPVALGFCAWAATILLSKDRQFLHDVFAKTRLVQVPATQSVIS